HLGRVQLAVVPGAFDELHHQHAQPLPNRAKRSPQRASCFALARPGINDQQSFFFRHRRALSRVEAALPIRWQSRRRAPALLREAPSLAWHADPAARSTDLAGTLHRCPDKSPRSIAPEQEEYRKQDRDLDGAHESASTAP